jgi:hypothetical protein
MRDGRDRRGARILTEYDPNVPGSGRRAEQEAINGHGGTGNLDNKRNEIRPDKWNEHGISPPKK